MLFFFKSAVGSLQFDILSFSAQLKIKYTHHQREKKKVYISRSFNRNNTSLINQTPATIAEEYDE